jgi:hypothetical protein
LYRSINKFKKIHKPRNNLVKEKNGDVLADSHTVLNRCKNYLSQLMFMGLLFNDVRYSEIHTAEPLVPQPSTFEAEIAIEKVENYSHQVHITFQQN